MEERFPMGRGGWLRVREDGALAFVRAELPDDGRGIYKAWLDGRGGSALAGTLLPEGGMLRLRRTLHLDMLRRAGAWPPTGARAELAFSPNPPTAPPPVASPDSPDSSHVLPQSPPIIPPEGPGEDGWRAEPCPGRRMGDAVLERAAEGIRDALCRAEGDGVALALPWSAGRAFPMSCLFCFARVEKFPRGTYAVFHFDGGGMPVFAQNAHRGGGRVEN